MQFMTLEHFAGCLNQTFHARLNDGEVEFVLVEAAPVAGKPRPDAVRAPFSLLFRNTSAFLMGWMTVHGEAGLTYEYLLHSPAQGLGQDNGGGYANADVDRLLAEAAAATRPDARRPLLRKVAEIARTELPVIPLYMQHDLYALAPGLVFEPRPDRMIRGEALRWSTPPSPAETR